MIDKHGFTDKRCGCGARLRVVSIEGIATIKCSASCQRAAQARKAI